MPKQEVLTRVRTLLQRQGRAGRNQHFADFSDPEGQEVVRLYRLYSSLAREITEASARPDMRVRAMKEAGGLRLEICDPKVNYRRHCLVPAILEAYFSQLMSELGLAAAPPQP